MSTWIGKELDMRGYLLRVGDPTLLTWLALVNLTIGVFFAVPVLTNRYLPGTHKLGWIVLGFTFPLVAVPLYLLKARRSA